VGRDETSPLGTSTTILLIVLDPDDRRWCMWTGRWIEGWQGRPKYSEKTCPIVALSITNPHDLTWDGTRAASVANRWVTTPAMARPCDPYLQGFCMAALRTLGRSLQTFSSYHFSALKTNLKNFYPPYQKIHETEAINSVITKAYIVPYSEPYWGRLGFDAMYCCGWLRIFRRNIIHSSSITKIETVGFSETFVTINVSTLCHNLEESSPP
jgi:hypothetical protein